MKEESTKEYKTQYGEIIVDPFFIKDPELYEIFQKSLPPREAYYFFPKDKDVIELHKKKPQKNVRRIFINVPYLEYEQKWLDEYKKIIDKHPENKLPDFWNDGLNLTFIYSTECKLEKSYQRMLDYFAWYKKSFPLNIQPKDKCMQILNSGFLYIHGRDHQFRPILICQPYILQKNKKEFAPNDIYNASIFLCQYMINYMMIPGQIENWIIFVNLAGTDGVTLPGSMTKLVKALSDYFVSRLYKCFVLGLHPFLIFIYTIVCKIVETVTVEKVIILKNKEDPKKNLYINEDNLEKRFGGEAIDLDYGEDNSLFPPRMPSDNFFLENENAKDILITEEEYIEKFNSGKIPQRSASPYLSDKLKIEKIDIKEEKEIKEKLEIKEENEIEEEKEEKEEIKEENGIKEEKEEKEEIKEENEIKEEKEVKEEIKKENEIMEEKEVKEEKEEIKEEKDNKEEKEEKEKTEEKEKIEEKTEIKEEKAEEKDKTETQENIDN